MSYWLMLISEKSWWLHGFDSIL